MANSRAIIKSSCSASPASTSRIKLKKSYAYFIVLPKFSITASSTASSISVQVPSVSPPSESLSISIKSPSNSTHSPAFSQLKSKKSADPQISRMTKLTFLHRKYHHRIRLHQITTTYMHLFLLHSAQLDNILD